MAQTEKRETRAKTASLVHLVALESPAKMEKRVTRAKLALMVTKALKVSLDPLVPLVRRALLEKMVLKVIKVLKAKSAPLEAQASLAKMVTKVTRVQTAILERVVVLVLEAHKVLQESPVRVALIATEVLTAVLTVLKIILSVTRRKLLLKSAKSNLTMRKRSGRLLKKHALRQRMSVKRKRAKEKKGRNI